MLYDAWDNFLSFAVGKILLQIPTLELIPLNELPALSCCLSLIQFPRDRKDIIT